MCLEHGKILKPSTGRCNDCKNIGDEENLSPKEQLVKWSDKFYLPTANKTVKQLCKQLIAYIAHHGGEISDLLKDVGYEFPAGVSVVKQKTKQIAKEIQVVERIKVVEQQLTDEAAIKYLVEKHPDNPQLQALEFQMKHAKLQEEKEQKIVSEPSAKKIVTEKPKYPPAQTITSKNNPTFLIQLDGNGYIRVIYQNQIIKEEGDIITVHPLDNGGMVYLDGKGKYTVYTPVFNLEKGEAENRIYTFSLKPGEIIQRIKDNIAQTNFNNIILFEYASIMTGHDYAVLRSMEVKDVAQKAALIKKHGVSF